MALNWLSPGEYTEVTMASQPTPYGRTRRTDTLQSVDESDLLELLTDDRCCAILEAVSDGPRTAGELIDGLDIPRSTLYRKVDRLVDAGLLAERTRIGTDGNHQSEYVHKLDAVSLEIDFCSGLEIELEDQTAADAPPMTIEASAD